MAMFGTTKKLILKLSNLTRCVWISHLLKQWRISSNLISTILIKFLHKFHKYSWFFDNLAQVGHTDTCTYTSVRAHISMHQHKSTLPDIVLSHMQVWFISTPHPHCFVLWVTEAEMHKRPPKSSLRWISSIDNHYQSSSRTNQQV